MSTPETILRWTDADLYVEWCVEARRFRSNFHEREEIDGTLSQCRRILDLMRSAVAAVDAREGGAPIPTVHGCHAFSPPCVSVRTEGKMTYATFAWETGAPVSLSRAAVPAGSIKTEDGGEWRLFSPAPEVRIGTAAAPKPGDFRFNVTFDPPAKDTPEKAGAKVAKKVRRAVVKSMRARK